MLIFMEKISVKVEEVRKKHVPEKFTRFQFTSKRKRMSTIIRKCENEDEKLDQRVHMKGAAEIVLEECNYYLNEKG